MTTGHGPRFAPRPCRPRDVLAEVGRAYPRAWARMDEMRVDRGRGLPDWPPWCFVPLAGAYAIVSEQHRAQRIPPAIAGDVARVGALGAWRVTQGIYRFDPAVYDAVRETPVDRDIPADVLYHLPEWCVYVETPGVTWAGLPVAGAWAHLECDATDGRRELRLLLDIDAPAGRRTMPLILHLGAWPIAEAVDRMIAQAQAVGRGLGIPLGGAPPGAAEMMRSTAEPILSLLLYVCSQAAEIGDGRRRPGNPAPVRTRRGWRLFPAPAPTTWDVGVRMGAALRQAYAASEVGAQDARAGPRAHVRRAHWHGYWSGRLDGERTYSLRWLPPIAVNVPDPVALPAVVRRVG